MNRGFEKRLERELARWHEKGWVNEQGRQAILSDLAARSARIAWSSLFVLAGALLLGLGVIIWIAAHWYEMSKWIKLTLIFFALAGSPVAYGLCLTRTSLPRLAQGFVLLSVLLFGAAIMLVGQMYHVDADFSDGLALWAGDALLAAWLLSAQPAMVASIALAALWTGYEQLEYLSMNWPLLGYLALVAGLLFQHQWKAAARAWGLLCLFWMMGWHAQPWLSEIQEDSAHVRLLAVQILIVAGCWGLMQVSAYSLVRAVRIDFLSALLMGAFIFTFPEFGSASPLLFEGNLPLWLLGLTVSVVIYTAGIVHLIRISSSSVISLSIGGAFAVGLALLCVAEVVFPLDRGTSAFLWNVFFLAVLYCVGDLGLRQGDRVVVNYVFVGFLTWVLARYFDTFWSLLDRALFFMVGGALLLVGGGWLEQRRRRVLHYLHHQRLP